MAEVTANDSSITTEEAQPFRISIRKDQESEPFVLEGWKAYVATGATIAVGVAGVYTIGKCLFDLIRGD